MTETPMPQSFSAQGLETPMRLLYPAYSPLRGIGGTWPSPPPRYVPGPQPEGTARVVLGDDYYLGAGWGDYRPQDTRSPEDVFDVPAEQRDRWQAAGEAYDAMQDEIAALMQARREAPQPVKRGAYIPQP